jgi:hypothetical protein
LETPLNFSYDTEESGLAITVYSSQSINVSGVSFQLASSDSRLAITGSCEPVVNNLSIQQITGIRTADGLHMVSCVDGIVSNMSQTYLQYGILLTSSRNIMVNNISSISCLNPVSPASFSDTIYVNGLVGSSCTATMNSHAAFNVNYENVTAIGDTYISNLRSVGGSVRNSVFNSVCTAGSAYWQSLALTDMTIYQNYDFTMENVEWNTPNNSNSWAGVGSSYGRRAIFKDVNSKTMMFGNAGAINEVHIIGGQIGYLYTRESNLNAQATVIDGNLYPSIASLMGFSFQVDPVFVGCAFKNKTHVIGADWTTNNTRRFIGCTFKDISDYFIYLVGNGYPGYNYCYEFDKCTFDNVYDYGSEISQSNSEADECVFINGSPILNPN